MSGIASILLAFWAAYFPPAPPVLHTLLWVVSVACFVMASYRVWVREHRMVLVLTARLEKAQKPKLPEARVKAVEDLFKTLTPTEKEILRAVVFIGHSRGGLNVGQLTALESIRQKTGFVIQNSNTGSFEISKESQPVLEALFEKEGDKPQDGLPSITDVQDA